MAALRDLKIYRSCVLGSGTGSIYEIRYGAEVLYSTDDYRPIQHVYTMLVELKARGYLKFDFQPFFDAKGAPKVFGDFGR